ncbi:FHA domain-containing protein [Streptacidiphilus sp. EB129]|uniref:FHA domain-containing protein n=1 Tax=Streptacidiphilus sp. EB129 TaxID=3156262 RepID=UPI00351545B0
MPQLVLELNGQRRTLEPGRSYSLGRDPQSDVAVDDARVSWRHATIAYHGNGWVLEDLGSTNGTYANGQRTNQVQLGQGAVVTLGNAESGPRLTFAGVPAPAQAAPVQQPGPAQNWHDQGTARYNPVGGYAQPPQQQPPQQQPPQQQPWQSQPYGGGVPAQQQGGYAPQQPSQPAPEPVYGSRNPTMVRNLAGGGLRTIRIGRGLDNELVVSDLSVSRHHAELRQLADGRYEIVDLDSHNGTYVNGQPISRVLLGSADIVGVGHSTFRLVGDQLEEFVDTGEVSFSARHLLVKVEHKGAEKILLNNVSFGVPEKSLVAVIGPSGSGKSTLLRALTGYRPADNGDVLYDGRNLYKQFAELRQRIGLVPQDDILHSQLTVRTALKYAAELRFPGDTEAAERERRVDEVLTELHLEKRADNKITALSGGQRKRVSVALELLTKPSLIFLDEPTSGLDPGMDRDVMKMLRGLADEGRTVLVVTHSVAELALCDRLLVMAPGGSVAYFGPPKEALHFFGYETWADVFQAFENYPDHDWAGRFRGSVHYQMYSADVEAVQAQSAQIQHEQTKPAKQQSWGSQLSTLVRRYLAVIASDRGFILLSLLLPAVLGVVSMVIPSPDGLAPGKGGINQNAPTILLIMAVGACFSGAANSVRELIKERVIYERERAVGLSRSAYLMSKVVVLGVVSVVQGILICGIGFSTRKLPTGLIVSGFPALEMTVPIILLSFASMMFGLVISSLVKTSEKTMPLLVMFAIVQVVFTGCLGFAIAGTAGLEQFAWLMPSRWAAGALGTTIDLGRLIGSPDSMWAHTATQWLIDCGALVVISAVLGFAVLRLLRRHEPEVMRQR